MNTIWKQLQNKKRVIALCYWSVTVPLLPMWFPNNQLAMNINTTIGIVLSAVGVGSAYAKQQQEKVIKEALNE